MVVMAAVTARYYLDLWSELMVGASTTLRPSSCLILTQHGTTSPLKHNAILPISILGSSRCMGSAKLLSVTHRLDSTWDVAEKVQGKPVPYVERPGQAHTVALTITQLLELVLTNLGNTTL